MPETVVQDIIGGILISTVKLDEGFYETIIVWGDYLRGGLNWAHPEKVFTFSERSARGAHNRALKKVRANFRYTRPRPQEERIFP